MKENKQGHEKTNKAMKENKQGHERKQTRP